jgi:hypothetical protein
MRPALIANMKISFGDLSSPSWNSIFTPNRSS